VYTSICLIAGSEYIEQEFKENNDPQFEATFAENTFRPYVLKARCKVEMWQDEARVKSTVVSVTPLDFREGCQELLQLINGYRS